SQADILFIIGTSMQVYPAANLINFANRNIPKFFIDPKPAINHKYYENLTVIAEKATVGVPKIVSQLIDL
ncbi:MAG: NAD-dependent deacylase, partial [Bacteroidetes bacterium]|nr:NAD-dependent deacylase [Bacteroidota bacterium]